MTIVEFRVLRDYIHQAVLRAWGSVRSAGSAGAVARSTLNRWFRGERIPDSASIVRLASICDIFDQDTALSMLGDVHRAVAREGGVDAFIA